MPTHTLAAIVDQVSFLPQRTGGTRHGRIRATTTAEGYVPKVACLFSLHVGTKSLFDCSKRLLRDDHQRLSNAGGPSSFKQHYAHTARLLRIQIHAAAAAKA